MTGTLVDVRLVLKEALEQGAVAIILPIIILQEL